MARAIWSGAISFGLVNIPVKLYPAVSRKSVQFHQIDRRTGSRVKTKRISATSGEEVPYNEIVKGYELPTGDAVLLDDDELTALDPAAARTIDIEEFVDLAEIDPVFYDAAYYLVPDKAMVKPYALLARAMADSQKVGIARFVMRTKQYLAAVRPKDDVLVLSTMVYADEVNDPASIDGLEAVAKVDLSDKELAMAGSLIASLSQDFEPEKHTDTYREQVLELIERKAAGEAPRVAPVAARPDSNVVDLLAALEASVEAAKAARGRHPSAHADETDEVAPAPKSVAKPRATAKAKATTESNGKAHEVESEDDAPAAKPARRRKTA
jgi:DNA end-binding protein Ku